MRRCDRIHSTGTKAACAGWWTRRKTQWPVRIALTDDSGAWQVPSWTWRPGGCVDLVMERIPPQYGTRTSHSGTLKSWGSGPGPLSSTISSFASRVFHVRCMCSLEPHAQDLCLTFGRGTGRVSTKGLVFSCDRFWHEHVETRDASLKSGVYLQDFVRWLPARVVQEANCSKGHLQSGSDMDKSISQAILKKRFCFL